MWPLVAFLLLYPLTVPVSDWLTARAGREAPTPTRGALALSLVVYLASAAVLAVHAFTHAAG